jgi:hypothetical protein
VVRISESPTAADRYEARVPDLREDHDLHSLPARGRDSPGDTLINQIPRTSTKPLTRYKAYRVSRNRTPVRSAPS